MTEQFGDTLAVSTNSFYNTVAKDFPYKASQVSLSGNHFNVSGYNV